MPNLKDIKTRINSVKSTQKITKAMKMISTARLNKARIDLEHHVQYADAMQKFVNALLPKVERDAETKSLLVKNFFQKRNGKTLTIVISTDKGLCGALNTFLFKELQSHVHKGEIILALGKKAFEYTKSHFKNSHVTILNKHPLLTGKVEYRQQIIDEVFSTLHHNNISQIKIIFPEFISVMVQKPKTENVPELHDSSTSKADFTIEGSPIHNLELAFDELISAKVQEALSQLLCSEHGARMIAMDNATNNAKARINSLTLVYNKTRQANITKEILEIVAGSQAI